MLYIRTVFAYGNSDFGAFICTEVTRKLKQFQCFLKSNRTDGLSFQQRGELGLLVTITVANLDQRMTEVI